MSENATHVYEGLFLFPQSAGADLAAAAQHVQDLLTKGGAEIASFQKWEERRLAYEIKGNKRGIFFLSYFSLPADQMAGLERVCGLSEELLRFLITRADHLESEQIEAAEGREALKEEIAVRAQQAEAGTGEVGVRATTRTDRETEDEPQPQDAEPAQEAPAQEAPAAEAGDEASDSDEPLATADA